MDWRLQTLNDIDALDLYMLMQLRQDVFVVEQNGPYLDLDGIDMTALHMSAWLNNAPLAYLRVIPPEIHQSGCPSLGRICTSRNVRRTGLGRELVHRGLRLVAERWPGQDCQIGAQAYLLRFYEEFGFTVNGEGYDEDGIAHFPMRWHART